MTSSPNLILAIEAAISGGSVCLIENGIDIGHRIGQSNISRAEDLLADVDDILNENGKKIADVYLLAVSAGPGSFTGIRIGIATGLGLTTGLDIEMATESALKGMAHKHRGHPDLIVAVPAGRDTVCYQSFDTSGEVISNASPSTRPEGLFLSSITSEKDTVFLLHADLFAKVAGSSTVIDFGKNVASAVGLVCAVPPYPKTPPMFISKDQ